jgi:hypothetical protein
LRPRRRVGSLCLKHERHKYLHGSPTARPLLKAEIKPYVKMVERAVKANRGHPALTDVYEALEALMQKSVEAASRIRSKPRPWDFTSRTYLELNRLHASGLTAVEMFTVASAVMLYCQWSNYDGPVLFCAVARHVLIARQLGAHRHDPRIGSRPIRCSLNARIEIGRAIVDICYPTLAAIGEVLSKDADAKQRRRQRVLDSLTAQPLKTPTEAASSRANGAVTSDGTKVVTYRNPPTCKEETPATTPATPTPTRGSVETLPDGTTIYRY